MDHFQKKCAALVLSGLSLFIALSATFWTPGPALKWLELRFPQARFEPGERFAGIIALGGDIERFEVALELAAKLIDCKVLLSVGSEEKRTMAIMRRLKIDASRVMLEERSTTTYENAHYAAKLLAPRPGEKWILVTSAFHMPRAVGAFRKAGFDVVPSPVFHQMETEHHLVAAREWLALAIYKLLGRSDALLPGPETIVALSAKAK